MPHQQAVQTHPQMLRETRQARQEELKRLTQVQRLVNQPGRKTREELVSLLDDIKKESISPDIVRPYTEQVGNRIRAMDEKKIKEICGDVGGWILRMPAKQQSS